MKISSKYLRMILPGIFCVLIINQGCEKFLNEKPDKQLAIPNTLSDFQALMDDPAMVYNAPVAGEISTDDYYLTEADLANLFYENHRRQYSWQPDNHFTTIEPENDWLMVYRMVFRANTILEGLKGLPQTASNDSQWKDIKGQALYYRGSFLMDGASLWTPTYDRSTSEKDLGLPIRLSTDFNQPSVRSSVEQTYGQILNDLKAAAGLLPTNTISTRRPSKAAAYGMLARVYLSMRDYPNAKLYADSCLQRYSTLMDFNLLSASVNFPISKTNVEIIVNRSLLDRDPIITTTAKIKPEVYNSYLTDDLRKTVFFRKNTDGSYRFKGSYNQNSGQFSGIAVNEMMLIRAECNARAGLIEEALEELNKLIKTRWNKDVVFIPFMASNKEEALTVILRERHKELLMRGLRWADIKRLNKEGANISLNRFGQTYTLPANDLRFQLPIPEDVILLSGMTQNKR